MGNRSTGDSVPVTYETPGDVADKAGRMAVLAHQLAVVLVLPGWTFAKWARSISLARAGRRRVLPQIIIADTAIIGGPRALLALIQVAEPANRIRAVLEVPRLAGADRCASPILTVLEAGQANRGTRSGASLAPRVLALEAVR